MKPGSVLREFDIPHILLFSLAYGGAIGLADILPSSANLVLSLWPAGGIGLASLLLLPQRRWPAMVAAFSVTGFVMAILIGRSAPASLSFMTANAFESTLSALVLTQYGGKVFSLNKVSAIASLVFSAVIVNACTALIGATTAALASGMSFWHFWFSWWVVDGISILLITPVVLCLGGCPRIAFGCGRLQTSHTASTKAKRPQRSPATLPGVLPSPPCLESFRSASLRNLFSDSLLVNRKGVAGRDTARSPIEYVAFFAIWTGIVWLAFNSENSLTGQSPHPDLLIVLLIWPAIRFDARAISLALLALAVITVSSRAILLGPSPLHGDSMTMRLLFAQSFLAITIITTWLLSASFAERREAEQRLREQYSAISRLEGELEEASRLAHVGYWNRNFIAESVTLSAEACRIAGLPQHNRFLKLPEWHAQWLTLIHPEDQPRVTQALADALAGGPRYNLEYRLVRSDGEVRYIHTSAEVTRDELGKPIHMFGTMIDITERKQAEQGLEAQHALLTAILNSSRDIIIFALDKDYCYTVFNEKHRQEMKKVWDADIKIGMNLLECMGIPEIRALAKQSIDRVLQGEVFTEVQRQPEPDIYYEFFWNPVIQNGSIIGATVFILDITERKRVEVALRTSQEALRKREAELNEAQRLAHIGSWDWDAVNDTIWWSEEYYRIYGLDPKKPTPNYLEHLKVYTHESAERLDLAVKRAMETGEPYEVDLELVRPPSGTHWVVARGEAKRDASGKIRGLRGTAQNITERKLAEQAIHRAKEELEQRVIERTAALEKKSSQLFASREALMNLVDDLNTKSAELEHANTRLKELDQLKSMFIASMSHELRTPLNSIIGFSSILLDEWLGALNEEQKKNMATVLRSGKHLLSLINDVIDVSKIEAGKLEISTDDFDLSDVLTEAAALFTKELRDKRLEFVLDPLHLQMRTDRRRLCQCLINLLGNAVKFTDLGMIRMTARLIPPGSIGVRAARDFVEIAVSDTGIGIRQEDIPKLFNAFVRLPLPAHISAKGTGLGLYLTGKMVREVLGGKIEVESFFGKGSCFTMRIPAKWQERSAYEKGTGD